jgi:hypothetical protein
VSIAIAASVEFPPSVAHLHLCTGNTGAARRVLEEALKSESSRGGVLMWAQKSTYRPMPSDWDRKMLAKIEELRADPKLRKEVEKFGRILPYALNEGAGREIFTP